MIIFCLSAACFVLVQYYLVKCGRHAIRVRLRAETPIQQCVDKVIHLLFIFVW